jgi:epoxyqueuosine reductase
VNNEPIDDVVGDIPIGALRSVALSAGLVALGVAVVEPFVDTLAILEHRKAEGLHGGMQFTYRDPKRSTDPARLLPGARSLVVGAWPYAGGDADRPVEGAPHGRVARYATGDHYGALRDALELVADRIRAMGFAARVVIDDNGLVDRAAAQRAGIGWFGHNANILVPGHGSWVVLGAIVTDAPFAESERVPDGCGSCRRCLDGCPTGAIIAPGVVDARRCLAWLVQAPGSFPMEHRVALGDRIYGCDDCQEVCPPSRRSPQAAMAVESEGAWVGLVSLLDSDDAELIERHGRWYIPKRDPRHLRRNALIALGNVADPSDGAIRSKIMAFAASDDEMLAEHARWALGRLDERSVSVGLAGA